MKAHIDKFFCYLDELRANYEDLSRLLKRKIEAVAADDVVLLDEIMKDEQVYLLVSRGLDQRIKDFRGKTGYKGEKLGDLVGELPEDERPRFTELHSRLRAAVDEANAFNGKCRSMTEARLHTLEKKLKELDKSGSVVYGKDSTQPMKPGALSKSI